MARRNRQTGTMIEVIDNRDGSFDEDAQFCPWVTLCEDHGEYCGHLSRKVAESFAASPADWCSECGEVILARQTSPTRREATRALLTEVAERMGRHHFWTTDEGATDEE